jgi:N-acyl-D-amino-acid deacylase
MNKVLLALLLWTVLPRPLIVAEEPAARASWDHELLFVTGEADERLRPFDDLMTAFVREHHVPGAALAVARGKNLVYARGFGFADLQAKTPVLPTSLFRIASISKPITAVATLKLVEQDQLSLDERVLDILQLEPHFDGDNTELDSRLQQVTVRQLLQHTAGWDRDVSYDPMFESARIAASFQGDSPASTDQIIRYMLGQRLDFVTRTRI